jgi:hypothetical protein
VLPLSLLSLIVFNLIPLLGVLFLGWNLSSILVLYWSENVVIGLFNVLKMALAQGEVKGSRMTVNRRPVQAAHRIFLIGFFAVHFGFFTFGHGIFVFTLFGKNLPSLSVLLPGILSLFVSHGISFATNFIGKGEYKRVAFPDLFMQPYKRIFIMHLTVILGAGAAAAMEQPVLALVVLIGLKIIVDVNSHINEHKKLQKL